MSSPLQYKFIYATVPWTFELNLFSLTSWFFYEPKDYASNVLKKKKTTIKPKDILKKNEITRIQCTGEFLNDTQCKHHIYHLFLLRNKFALPLSIHLGEHKMYFLYKGPGSPDHHQVLCTLDMLPLGTHFLQSIIFIFNILFRK